MSTTIQKIVSRIANKTMIQAVACPQCGAQPGRRCAGGASHQARWGAFKEQTLKAHQSKGK